MAGQQQQATPRHVPLSEITHQGLLRALGAEAETLQKIHVRIQRQLQNLEMEEKLIKQMMHRERSAQSPGDLQQFDLEQQLQQQQQEHAKQQQQQEHAKQQQHQQQQVSQQAHDPAHGQSQQQPQDDSNFMTGHQIGVQQQQLGSIGMQ